MAVTKVSLNEIKSFRENNNISLPQKESKPVSKTPEKRYVDRISDNKVIDFFTPYGYRYHERSEDGAWILVLCNDMQIIFDDYSVMAEPVINLFAKETGNFYLDFASQCELANITPSQAIADRLEDEIFNSMPYYVEKKRKFVENNLNAVANHNKFGNLLKASAEKQLHRENLASLNKTYGSCDPEKIADTLARLNPNK